jgi:lysozyme
VIRKVLVLAPLVLLLGCGHEAAPEAASASTAPSNSAPGKVTPSSPVPSTSPPSRPITSNPPDQPDPNRPKREQGIDVSHHQGPIQWSLVAGTGITFAYLKATEASSFQDPMFPLNTARAQASGIRVGAYHYFRYCAAALPQAKHFTRVLAQTQTDLPPAVDVERDRCQISRSKLIEQVRAFITEVERTTGKSVVLYVYPDVEAKQQLRKEFSKNPQWVRSIGRAPADDWWLWQKSDRGTVAGISGRVDLNVMSTP